MKVYKFFMNCLIIKINLLYENLVGDFEMRLLVFFVVGCIFYFFFNLVIIVYEVEK